MSRALKAAAVAIAIVVLLTVIVTGTVYSFRGDQCGSGEARCGQQHRHGCIGSGLRQHSDNCSRSSRCTAGSRP